MYNTNMCYQTVLLVRLPVKSWLVIVKFGGSQKLHSNFQVSVPGSWFKGQLHYR